MNISENFIRRPIATSLIMAGIAMFGIIAYRALPVSDLPQVDYPTITVSASLPGANPDTMASAVATPMERQFTSIAGLDSMISSSSQGSSNITLQFDLSRDIDGATVDVETAIAEAMPLLPPGMPTPPSFRKVNPGDHAIISLFLTSPTMRLSDLDEYAETMVAQRISMVDGVAQVQVFGSAKYAVRVQVDPNQLASRRIGLNEIDAALQNWNVNIPTGTLYGPHTAYNVQVNGQLMRAWEYRPMIIAYRNGAAVRLEDVAHVIDSVEDDKNVSQIYGGEYGTQGTRGVNLQVMRQPGSNTIEVIDNIKRAAARLPGADASLRAPGNSRRPLQEHSRSFPGHPVHHGRHPGPGHHGDFPVPAQFLRHHDSRHGAAVLHRGHVLGDVPAEFQHQQHFHDGADPLHRLRGG